MDVDRFLSNQTSFLFATFKVVCSTDAQFHAEVIKIFFNSKYQLIEDSGHLAFKFSTLLELDADLPRAAEIEKKKIFNFFQKKGIPLTIHHIDVEEGEIFTVWRQTSLERARVAFRGLANE